MSERQDPDKLLTPEEIQRINRNVNALGNRVGTLSQQIDEMQQRIEHQQYVIDRLVTDLPTQTRSKREKKAAIIRRAVEDASNGASRAAISKPKAAGAADCSERHVLNLFNEIGSSWDWAAYDKGAKPHARLLLDFGEHGKDAFLNRIATEFPEVNNR